MGLESCCNRSFSFASAPISAFRSNFSSLLVHFRDLTTREGDINVITPNEAFCIFDYMLRMHPSPPPVSSFNILLASLAKNKHYDT
ncbi:hypothetical protein CISIN_1g0400271mg, partial [Citrus sinensis]